MFQTIELAEIPFALSQRSSALMDARVTSPASLENTKCGERSSAVSVLREKRDDTASSTRIEGRRCRLGGQRQRVGQLIRDAGGAEDLGSRIQVRQRVLVDDRERDRGRRRRRAGGRPSAAAAMATSSSSRSRNVHHGSPGEAPGWVINAGLTASVTPDPKACTTSAAPISSSPATRCRGAREILSRARARRDDVERLEPGRRVSRSKSA